MMPNGEIILVIGISLVALVVVVLIVKFFRQILLALLAVAVLGVGAYILIIQGQANQDVAKVASDVARSSASAATAATVSSAGQTVSSLALLALSGVLTIVTLVALGGVGYFWIRLRQADKRAVRRWKPGPNAMWARAEVPAGESWTPVLMGQMLALQQTVASLLAQGSVVPARPNGHRQRVPRYDTRLGFSNVDQHRWLGWEVSANGFVDDFADDDWDTADPMSAGEEDLWV